MLRWLLWKDLRRELRSKEGLQAGVVLVGLFGLLYLFVGPTLSDRAAAIALWAPLLWGTAAVTGRGLGQEADRGTLEWLRSTPVPVALHGISRTLTDLVLAAIVAALTLAMLAGGFAVTVSPRLILVIMLASLGLTIIGSLTGGLAAQARSRDILLPILLIPAAAPLVHAGVMATLDALAGTSDRTPIILMAGFDLVAAGIAWLLWPFVLEAD